jgi:subfamily B ATP-binding cassette protein MsbA
MVDERRGARRREQASDDMIRRLAAFAVPHVRTLALAIGLLGIATVIEALVIPILLTAFLFTVMGGDSPTIRGFDLPIFGTDLVAGLTRRFSTDRPSGALLAIAAAGLAAMSVKCACDAGRFILSHKFGHLVARDLRARLFEHLVRQPPSFYDRERAGALLSRVTADVVSVQQSLGPPLFEVVQAPLALGLALAMMLSLSWWLTLATLCVAPVIAWAVSRAGHAVRVRTVARQDRLAALNAYLAERLAGSRLIQAFGREDAEVREMASLNQAYYGDALRSVLVSETIVPISQIVAIVGTLAGLLAGGLAVLAGMMPAEHFILFFAVAPLASTHAGRLARIGPLYQQVSGALVRLFELLDHVPAVRDEQGAAVLPRVRGRVVFENVGFEYREGLSVLSGVDLEIEPGEVIGIVGPSGAGKSTLINLVPRFYDATEGRVLIDGHDVRRVTLASLRSQIAVVSQEPTLFAQSIADNIRYGRSDATDDDVRAAARAANALEFIDALPRGFATRVGERGMTLSGGQRQRLAIARAILRDPRILLLDEATSAVDEDSERLIQQALQRFVSGRTTFIVAHRHTTIACATRVIELEGGRIAGVHPGPAGQAAAGAAWPHRDRPIEQPGVF